MKSDLITVAVIGCGRFSRNFIRLFKAHPAVKKVYVCDLLKDRAEEYANKFGVETINSFEDALSSTEINAIAIFTPRETHGKMVIESLKANKHVYSAVPVAISVEDIIEIEKLVRKTRLTYSMGETGAYRASTIFCRREFKKGSFGKFVYGEAQYNHDIKHMIEPFMSSGGENWRKTAGIPPFFYPTHSTSSILSAMPNVYATEVVAMGYEGCERTDIFGTDNQNYYNNPFSNQSMLLKLSNGGIARISENRCVGWTSPATYISQFFGSKGCYEFSFARHHQTFMQDSEPYPVEVKDVTKEIQPDALYDLIESDYKTAIQKIVQGEGYYDTAPIQRVRKLPKEFVNIPNGHNGTHHFLIDDFCRAVSTGKLSPTNIWASARYNIPGLIAHESALLGGKLLKVPDLGDPPSDWEVLDFDS